MFQNTSVESSENTEQKLILDFEHRLSMLGQDNTKLVVQDTIDIMCCRAIAVLESLSSSLIYGGNKLSDSVMYWSLNSAIMELKDIQDVLNQDKNTPA
jgi:hypothetical protein